MSWTNLVIQSVTKYAIDYIYTNIITWPNGSRKQVTDLSAKSKNGKQKKLSKI